MLFGKKKVEKKKNLLDLKNFLKEKAKRIREIKPTRKEDKRGDRKLYEIVDEIYNLKFTFRHYFIAYCEMRGRTRDQIEKPADNNLPKERVIEKAKEEYEAVWPKRKETICDAPAQP